MTLGANYSKESDYIGRGVWARWAFGSDDRNTTWTFGAAFGRDDATLAIELARDLPDGADP